MPRTLLRQPPSTPEQGASALISARELLVRLCNAALTPRVPGSVRREARALLRHYPDLIEQRAEVEALLHGPDRPDPAS